MPTWQSYNLGSLLPQTVADAVGLVGDVSGQVATATEAAAAALDALSAVIVDVNDPLRSIIDQLIATLENTIHDTLNTGVHLYWDVEGWPIGPPLGLAAWKGRFKRSFDDPGDENRPIFSNDAEVGAIVLVGGADSLTDLMPLFKALGELFGIKTFLDAWARFADGFDGDPLDDVARGISVAPDWYAVKLADVLPPFGALGQLLGQVMDGLRGAGGVSDLLQDLVRALEDKAERLQELSSRLQDLLDQIAAILQYSGLYVLAVESTTGTEGINDGLEGAAAPPPFKADAYIAGVCVLAGAADYAKLAGLFGL